MKTGCFKTYKGVNGVAICLYPPWSWKGETYKQLAPWYRTLHDIKTHKIDHVEYERQYRELVLAKLDPMEICRMFENKVLLCYELPNQFCHRFLVRDWVWENTGIEVKEWNAKDIDEDKQLKLF